MPTGVFKKSASSVCAGVPVSSWSCTTLSTGANKQAIAAYRSAQLTLTSAIERKPTDHVALSYLGRTLSNLATLVSNSGQTDEAAALIDDALKFQQQAVELAPEQANYQEIIQYYRHQLADIEAMHPSTGNRP